MAKDDEKILFAQRLNELCDDKKLPSRGRQTILKNHFISQKIKMSQESTRKWLKGESIPIHEHKLVLCDYFETNYNWLASGDGEKYRLESSETGNLLGILGLEKEDVGLDLITFIRIYKKATKEKRDDAKRMLLSDKRENEDSRTTYAGPERRRENDRRSPHSKPSRGMWGGAPLNPRQTTNKDDKEEKM